jgi:4'-phosphopantetheinyl transferase EntD
MVQYEHLLLQSSIDTFDLSGILVGHRVIAHGDERALFPEEARSLASGDQKRRRASGAARIAARELLGRLGYTEAILPRSASGGPVWPKGIIGSIAHDHHIAIATVGMRRDVIALGIDIEPAKRLDPDLVEIVLSPREQEWIADDPFRGMLFFVAKEAVYKALHPLNGKFLDHHDVVIDVKARKARVCGGSTVDLRFSISSHLVAVAFLMNSP